MEPKVWEDANVEMLDYAAQVVRIGLSNSPPDADRLGPLQVSRQSEAWTKLADGRVRAEAVKLFLALESDDFVLFRGRSFEKDAQDRGRETLVDVTDLAHDSAIGVRIVGGGLHGVAAH